MKILVCTDGSKESIKAIEETAKIASGCNINEVSVIHVYDTKFLLTPWGEGYYPTKEDMDELKKREEKFKENSKKNLLEAEKIFEAKNIKIQAILKEGHPAETIVKVASEGEFDMVVLGRRGMSGLKKLFLGSVSNAVLQEINTSVLIVK
ncbi:universal stress protein A, putative [Clostridium aceticum]|uniref:Universal stress protein A, putative n=1 Tax=Clostridium aceticum TaxID=84022 RepID=A0A0D8I653_9CLOT|nr:universal stress protein [Clostridium aceticum]AKL96926.1 universal stress protein A, putative [Clostridium aceticum]KJF25502.1 universal stress protein UspA [Clostridium aceticum]